MLTSPVFFAWVASITYGLYAIVAKLIGKYQLKNTAQFSFFVMLFSGIVLAIIAYWQGGRLAVNWWYILLAATFVALGNLLYLTALKVIDVSVMASLFNIRVAITVLLGVVILGETLSTNALSLTAIIFFAGFFATMDERFSFQSFFTKNIGLGLVFMLVLSIQSIFVNRAIDQTDYWTATLWMSLFAIVISFVFLYPKFKKDLHKTRPREYLGTIALSLIAGIGDLAAYKAYAGNVGISAVIISLPLSMVMAFLLAMWKPKLLEKHTFKVYLVRFAAAAIMIWGALKLSGV